MAGIAQNIELYNLAHRLAWKHISELQKRVHSNIARTLHGSIRRQLKEGAAEPVMIASEALRDIERLNGQIDSDEEQSVPANDDRNNRLRRALRLVKRSDGSRWYRFGAKDVLDSQTQQRGTTQSSASGAHRVTVSPQRGHSNSRLV